MLMAIRFSSTSANNNKQLKHGANKTIKLALKGEQREELKRKEPLFTASYNTILLTTNIATPAYNILLFVTDFPELRWYSNTFRKK